MGTVPGPAVDGQAAALASFAGLTVEEAAALHAEGTGEIHRPRSVVLHEGVGPDTVALLIRGFVKVSLRRPDVARRRPEDAELLLYVVAPQGPLTPIAGVASRPGTHTVTSLTDVAVVGLPSAAWQRLVARHHRLLRMALDEVARRLREAERQRVVFAANDAVGRISSRILDLERFGERTAHGTRLTVGLTQSELASWADVSREAASRAIRLLRERGWLSVRGPDMVVRNRDALQRRVFGY